MKEKAREINDTAALGKVTEMGINEASEILWGLVSLDYEYAKL